ncbi:MAG TPA: hypothetical protein VLQ65_12555, partial [Saliniramus sp.]|nr:hypothetical protein [Saliniramus sp.]
MTTLDMISSGLKTGATLDLADATTNKQVTQFLTQLNAVANPDTEIAEGEAFSLVANSGDGNFLVSADGTSFETGGEEVTEIDIADLFSLDDIDLSEIDFGDLELDEETLELIQFMMENPETVELFSEGEVVFEDEEGTEVGDGEDEVEGEGEDEVVDTAVDDYKEKLAKQLEEMDEMLAIGDLSAQAQKE